MTNDDRNALLATRTILIDMKDPTKRDKELGICDNLWCKLTIPLTTITNTYLDKYFKDWPHFSGHPTYPIEGSRELFMKQEDFEDMWNTDNKFGRLRHELRDYLIECVERDLREYSHEE